MKISDVIKYLVEFQWLYIAYALPAVLLLMWFYFKNKEAIFSRFNGFVNWIRPSFETGGFASPEKLTAFSITTFAYIPGRLIFALQITDPVHLLYGSVIDAVFVLVLYKIISPAQLLELKDGIKPSQPNQETK